MNEGGLDYSFRKTLKPLLPEAVILKHSDNGMIGLPDCSVNYTKRIWWLEFKLLRVPKSLELSLEDWALNEIRSKFQLQKGPQERMMNQLALAAHAWYCAFLSTGEVLLYDCFSGKHIWTTRKQAPATVRDLVCGNLSF